MSRPFQQDYYAILQVDPKAEPEVIQAAYRRLAAKYHPDAGGDEERMKRINEAWDVLGDPQRRRAYDRWYFTLGPGRGRGLPAGRPLDAGGAGEALGEAWQHLKWPLLLTLGILLLLSFDIFRLGVRLLPDWTIAALLVYLLLRRAWRR